MESRWHGQGSAVDKLIPRHTDTADWESTRDRHPVRNSADRASIYVDKRPHRDDGRSTDQPDSLNCHDNESLESSKQKQKVGNVKYVKLDPTSEHLMDVSIPPIFIATQQSVSLNLVNMHVTGDRDVKTNGTL